MLKLSIGKRLISQRLAAAFGRLCVETSYVVGLHYCLPAAAFGRLCVETFVVRSVDW